MCNFKVGQRVVCVRAGLTMLNRKFTPLTAGATYVILGMSACKSCGRVAVDVGLRVPKGTPYHLCTCGDKEFSPSIWWLCHSRFRPIDELTDQMDRIEKEGCPAELVEELTKALEMANN